MAGNSQIIDEVVSPLAEKQVNDLKAASAALNAEFAGLLKTTIELNSQIGKVANNSKFAKAQEQAALAAEKLAQAQAKTVLAQQKIVTETAKAQQAQQRQIQLEQANAAKREAISAKKRQTIISDSAAEVAAYEKSKNGEKSVTSTVNERRIAEINAANAATAGSKKSQISIKLTEIAYKNAQVSITGLTEKLIAYKAVASDTTNPETLSKYNKKIQETTAKISQLSNIGKEGFDNFGNKVEESGGFLGDSFSLLKDFAAILPGIGVAGILAFASGPIIDYIASLDLFSDKVEEATKEQTALNEAVDSPEVKSATIQFKELTTNINLANQGLISKDSVLKEYNETIGKTAGYAKTFNEAEDIMLKRGDKVLQLIILKTAAQSLLTKASEKATERAIELNKTELESTTFADRLKGGLNFELPGLFESAAKVREREGKKTIEQQKKLGAARRTQNAADLKKEEDQFLKAFDTLQKEAADFAKKNNLNFFGDSGEPEKEKTKKVKDTTVKDELTALEYQYNEQIELARALDKDTLELEKEYEKQILNLRKQFYEQQKGDIENAGLANLEAIQDAGNAELLENEKLYAKGEISKTEYERNKLDIEHTANRDSIEAELSLASQLLDIRASYGEDVSADKKKLSELTRKLAKNDADYEIAKLKEVAEQRKAVNAATKQLAEAAGEFIIELVNAGFTNRKNALRAEQDALEERTQNEINAVDRSLATEQQKADKIAVINAKANAEKERIAKEQRKIDTEKAKFDKAVAIARIIENTAIGITSALASLNVPLAILIGALGAVQLGTVLAQPIPQYAKGTKSAKGGLSIVGERGRELVETPSGMSFLTADTAQMINLPKGSKVTPHHETMRMIGRPENLSKYSGGEQIPWREMMDIMKANKPEKNRTAVNVKVDAGFYQYRQNHFS